MPEGQGGDLARISLRTQARTGYVQVARSLILRYPQRTALCVTLLATQAFCYNAVFFTYGLILKRFYGVPDQEIGWYLLAFAVGNVLGPLLLGRLFDTIGRRVMIAATYALSGVLLGDHRLALRAASGRREAADALLVRGVLLRLGRGQRRLSDHQRELPAGDAGDDHRHLQRVRQRARRRRRADPVRRRDRRRRAANLLVGYLVGGGLMLFAAIMELAIGVDAERKPLEEVAPPLSQVGGPA